MRQNIFSSANSFSLANSRIVQLNRQTVRSSQCYSFKSYLNTQVRLNGPYRYFGYNTQPTAVVFSQVVINGSIGSNKKASPKTSAQDKSINLVTTILLCVLGTSRILDWLCYYSLRRNGEPRLLE